MNLSTISLTAIMIISQAVHAQQKAEANLIKEINEQLDSFSSYMNDLNSEELKKFYAKDPNFYWIEDGRVEYPNREALVSSLSGLVNSMSKTSFSIKDRKVTLLSDTSAMLYVGYDQSMTLKSDITFSINGAMTILLKKEEEQWYFLIGHSSTKKQRGN